MIKGTGIDICEIERIQELRSSHPKFVKRILTTREIDRFEKIKSDRRRAEYLAGRFAAKEAYAKAVGCGIGKQLSFHSLEIISDENGKPFLFENGEKQKGAHVSISHSRAFAVAQVIIEN
ncbi:holo-ACP synthase [Halalkalibacillus sediminis]|uniref:Holo-[acyl-carrier-protein] synthase n=1 Tax=Halalkalibacillus sediminis TaxID=2018042 RepID=A0A2I0QRP9_9BACI|nr:holo-ACP synthase [Halalkalibacillus sediminis]PKR77014.1 holo-ACP synthase [Halalkalibacillus sediminis]